VHAISDRALDSSLSYERDAARLRFHGITGVHRAASSDARNALAPWALSATRHRERAREASSFAGTMSLRCPSVTSNVSGSPSASTTRCPFVEGPPRERPIPFAAPPFAPAACGCVHEPSSSGRSPGHARPPPPEHGFDEVPVVPPSPPRASLGKQHALNPRPLLIAKLPANHARDGTHRRHHGEDVR